MNINKFSSEFENLIGHSLSLSFVPLMKYSG